MSASWFRRAKGWLGPKLFSQRTFETLQRFGAHLTRRHYHSPIPDTAELAKRAELWQRESELPGIDMRPQEQLQWLREVAQRFLPECDFPSQPTADPHRYYIRNESFGLVSATVLHAMVRHLQPRLVLEVGGGMSTLVTTAALRRNAAEGHGGKVVAVDPDPDAFLRTHPDIELVQRRTEDLDPDLFLRLGNNDILFIDSTHVVRTGGDVNFLFLEVLPRLNAGTYVQVHDIFFPFEYPREWVVEERRFWSEQYLLQAFLVFNTAFQPAWCESYMKARYPEEMERLLPGRLGYLDNYDSNSFWMRKLA